MSDFHSRLTEKLSIVLGEDADAPDLSFVPAHDECEVWVDDSGRRLEIAYVAADPWPPSNFWGDNGERGTFRRFRVKSTRERFLSRLESDQGIAFDVEAGEDGVMRAKPLGQVSHPMGVYAVDAATARAVREGRAEMRDAVDAADKVLADFSAWSAGESCGVVVEKYKVSKLGNLSQVDHQAHWVVSCADAASRTLSGYLTGEPIVAPSELAPRV